MAKIALSGRTDVGLKRTNNEDTFVVKPELNFCLVADGMGGAAAGELASRFFAETAIEVFSEADGCKIEELPGLVQKTFIFANERILNHVKKKPEHEGMGCTAELMAW